MSHPRNPRSLLTPAVHQLLDRMARTRQLPLHALTPQQARQVYEMGSGMLDIPGHKLTRVEELSIPTRDGAA
ncbi:MAG TPA: alpha/beta hydrolase, partial [Curvibacter sp.]|nr:alpha/beta hydrolase [Curvibacter sp.]